MAYHNKNEQVYSPASGYRGPHAPVDNAYAAPYAAPYATPIDAAGGPHHHHHHAPLPHGHVLKHPPHHWQIGFCSCLGAPKHCCGAFFVPCFNAAYAAHHIGWSAAAIALLFFVTYWGWAVFSSYTAADHSTGTSYNGYYTDTTRRTYSVYDTVATVCALVFIAATATLRSAVRRFDGIPGSSCNDLCASFWCSCCVLSQLSAHTERVKPLREENAATLPAYHAV